MNSILTTIKLQLGIEEDAIHFDSQIIMNINTAISILTQIGIGPTEGFLVITGNEEWTDFIGLGSNYISAQTFIYIKTKLLFDPPANQTLLNSLTESANELLWRLRVQSETS